VCVCVCVHACVCTSTVCVSRWLTSVITGAIWTEKAIFYTSMQLLKITQDIIHLIYETTHPITDVLLIDVESVMICLRWEYDCTNSIGFLKTVNSHLDIESWRERRRWGSTTKHLDFWSLNEIQNFSANYHRLLTSCTVLKQLVQPTHPHRHTY